MSKTLQYKIQAPDAITSVIQLPSSKSISNRALILNALSLTSFDVSAEVWTSLQSWNEEMEEKYSEWIKTSFSDVSQTKYKSVQNAT